MSMMTRAPRFGAVCLGAAALFLAGACGDDDDGEATATATEAADTATAPATAPATEQPTESPTTAPAGPDFVDAGEVIEGGNPVAGVAIIEDVRVGQNEGFDRIVFEFRGDEVPAWTVQYIQEAFACGSGKPVPVGGGFILDVDIRPAAAHEDGDLTIDATQLTAGFPQMTEAVQICDFEAVVQWVVGTGTKARFRAFELEGPARLVVDVEQ
jgi:hypothetical protein